ncbi:Metallophosphoesterase [Oceanicaulis alexandrii HTCC2633]|uniref:metallophosphoesterase family protein n=1 Tax=Oceanicaulis sp. HTCC2633 TaxID=314254 RepID=UPI000066C961|nr:DNA repair exonuclease [Oceanicaulis sp. HTCC2633]EAP88693.1 Metallophosphoesterase [Oceanicaulis alexandrii HTCC2633] [Oceanicaulis sp. HTCC2633]
MTSFRFFHAADIHLDSPLRGLAGQEGNAVARVRTATREALDMLVGLAIEEQVDFLIFAGDLYDGDWRDYNTGLFFAKQMGRLKKKGIPVYLLHGNHDAESQITRRLELPDNVHVFGTRKPETFALDELKVALHGQSFRQRDITENLVPDYPAPVSGAFNIGVLHTGLGGMGGHENYAPCAMEDLINKGYNYWALGHVHKASVLHKKPHVVFPGNLQGRHARETGAKGASLVTVEDGDIVELTTVPCDVVRWAVLPVSLADAERFGDVIDRIHDAVEAAVTEADGRLLACRIVLQGRTAVHEQLIASEVRMLAEARAGALGLGDEVAWVEKVVINTQPEVDAETLAEREDAIGELQRLLQEATGDDALLAQIEDDISKLVRQLPHEVRGAIDDSVLKAAVDGDYAILIGEVSPYLSARLTAQGD